MDINFIWILRVLTSQILYNICISPGKPANHFVFQSNGGGH